MNNLLLRPPLPSDLDAVIRIHADPLTNQFNPSGPASPDICAEMLQGWLQHWAEHDFGYWAVADTAAPERVIGFGGICHKNIAGQFAGLNMYFRFAPEAWGKGYASQTSRAALELAFGKLAAESVFALVRPDNLPSRRTLERTGFQPYASVDDVTGEAASLIYRMAAPQRPR